MEIHLCQVDRCIIRSVFNASLRIGRHSGTNPPGRKLTQLILQAPSSSRTFPSISCRARLHLTVQPIYEYTERVGHKRRDARTIIKDIFTEDDCFELARWCEVTGYPVSLDWDRFEGLVIERSHGAQLSLSKSQRKPGGCAYEIAVPRLHDLRPEDLPGNQALREGVVF
ncbi:unnamed protein product [Nesidiocoris tenuis]|uniref:Uncharacterized protein n=1 Tax=Nesidiocoris tenuis TaxID=355587 RepID=A0A6H5H7Q3_9HEMI|nr:unnamed protein product [Nesidiocoris tenuis]